jgi:hypothetical protein
MTLGTIMETYALDLLFGGLAVAALAWIWLIVSAFRQTIWWGASSLVLPPVALLFALRHAQKAVGPLLILVLGGLIAATPVCYSLTAPADVKLREKLSEGPRLYSLGVHALQSDPAHEWMESRAFYMQLGGVAAAALAWIWLIVRAFRQHRRWGLGSLFLPPVGFAFASWHPRKGAIPLILVALCLLVAAAPAIYTLCVPLDLGERDKMVNGQRHLTLTGWDRKDYAILKLRPDVVVLQMANPDVTDQTLESLKPMNSLQELDLSDTQVTDIGLATLKSLPALATLRLARTKITDQGFHNTIFAKDSLIRLDLRGTQVSHETAKSWQSAKAGRRASQ